MSADGTGTPGHDFVRPFIMTRGRTARAARHDIRFETLVQRRDARIPGTVPSEQVAILRMSGEPISVAELGSSLGLVLGVVTVLVNDLFDEGLIDVFTSAPDDIELDMLTRMADKIRSL